MSTTYAYDANGIRAKKVENGATTHYLALGHTVMYEKTGAVGTRHIFAGSQRIAEVKDGVVSFFYNDHLSSPRAVTDAAGVVTAAVIATTPFGEPHTNSALTSYMFTGKDLDDTSLYYFAARYYDASNTSSCRICSNGSLISTLVRPMRKPLLTASYSSPRKASNLRSTAEPWVVALTKVPLPW